MRYFIVLSILMALVMPANAQQSVCGNRDEIISRLKNGYQESTTGIGLSTNGGVIELYTSERGSFTLMVTQPNGVSCLIAAGDNWETIKPKPNLGDAY